MVRNPIVLAYLRYLTCPPVRFVLETPDLIEDSYIVRESTPTSHEETWHPRKEAQTAARNVVPQVSGDKELSPADLRVPDRALCDIPRGSQLGVHSPDPATEAVAFPLQDAKEARLMAYYLEYMCTWVSCEPSPFNENTLLRVPSLTSAMYPDTLHSRCHAGPCHLPCY